MTFESKLTRMESEVAGEELDRIARERDEARERAWLFLKERDAARAELELLRSMERASLVVKDAEERGARWALEEAGHGLFNQTREERARSICDAARASEAAKLKGTP